MPSGKAMWGWVREQQHSKLLAAGRVSDSGFRDSGFGDGGFRDGGFRDGGFKDGGFRDSRFRDGGFKDGGFRVHSTGQDNNSGGASEASFCYWSQVIRCLMRAGIKMGKAFLQIAWPGLMQAGGLGSGTRMNSTIELRAID